MNMYLHNNPTAEIADGNTLESPKFLDNDKLRTFNYVVANPPFSAKSWTDRVNVENDPYERFANGNIPLEKTGIMLLCFTC